MKIAKVITTTFVPRSIREHTVLCGDPLGYFSHSQNFTTEKSIIDLIRFTLELEDVCDPGEHVDLIIVNNDSGWHEGRVFLDTIDGKQLRHGNVKVMHRGNYGRSFGGYNHAFMALRNDYDYFVFTEDDILVNRDGYAAIGLEIFTNTTNCGFVAYQCLSRVGLDCAPEDAFSAHGGVGMSSAAVLSDVVNHFGCLPHAGKSASQAYENIIRQGEIPFTNNIYKLGYRLVSTPKGIKLYDYAYDLMRGIEVPRFPSFPTKAIHIAKNKAYRIDAVRKLHSYIKTISLNS